MQFYEIECLNQNYDPDNKMEYSEERRTASNIKNITSIFNNAHGHQAYFFPAVMSGEYYTIGAIVNDADKFEKLTNDYLNRLAIDDLIACLPKEITFRDARNMLRTARDNHYLLDVDDVLEQFELDRIDVGWRRLEFGENLLSYDDKETIYDKASNFFADESLIPEMDRIFEGSSMKIAKGHPVHYLVQTDDKDVRKDFCRVLLSALYANDRIESRRYCYLDVASVDEISESSYEGLYKSSFGGTVIVRYTGSDVIEDEYASTARETVEYICKILQKYKNKVLTIVCMPRECNTVKEMFYENMGTTGIIEIKEDIISADKSEAYLKRIGKKRGIRTDKKLIELLDGKKLYMAAELNRIFDDWYEEKLKTKIYPQYVNVSNGKTKIAESKPKGNAYDELMEMIGLDNAKQVILDAINFNKAKKVFASKGMLNDSTSMHMIFTGNPGTAKTTVARLFARIMRENGLLSKGHLIEVGRGDLVGKYVGWTAQIIKKKFADAKGSVLFIDEAYSLVDDRSGSFGDEAINTIVQEMENHRNDVVVIFAGYPDKMEGFLNKNPGLRSRIAYHVNFDDYNSEELCSISELIASKDNLKFTDGAKKKLLTIYDEAQKQSDFGNGRYARNIIEQARIKQANRLLELDYDNVSKEDIETIQAEDIEVPALKKCKEKQIGFCA